MITSSASIKTQSAAGRPSMRGVRPSRVLLCAQRPWWPSTRPAGWTDPRRSPCSRRCSISRQGDGYDVHRLIVVERLQDETMEVFNVDWSAAGTPRRQAQRDVRSRGLLVGKGEGGLDPAIGRGRGRQCQLGSCARMAVAEVGSGGRRRNKIAGALHSVHRFAWLDGWTNRLSQPIARAAWASRS